MTNVTGIRGRFLSHFDLGAEQWASAGQRVRSNNSLNAIAFGPAALVAIESLKVAFLLALVACVLVLVAKLLERLARKDDKTYFDVACWLLVTIGILARQLALPDLTLRLGAIAPSVLIASGIFSLAAFPAFMRFVSKNFAHQSLSCVAAPFSFGFCLDCGSYFAAHASHILSVLHV